VKLGDWVKLGNGVQLGKSPLQIQGTRHLVIFAEGLVQIGCFRMALSEWEEKADMIGKESGYTPDEIAEYKRYLRWIKEVS
jgi:hypothetical protein